MTIGRTVGFSAGVAILFALSAFGQEEPAAPHRGPHGGEHPAMQRADQNGDGVISYDEAIESLPGMTDERFKHLDVNSDGQLELEEMRPRGRRGDRGPGAARDRFSEADTDKDGTLSRSEIRENVPRFPEERFDAADVDGDGGLTIEELTQSRMRPSANGDRRAARGGFVERLDTDGDGEVSLEEFRAVRPDMDKERFSRVDADKSGGVSRDEFRAVAADRPSPAQREAFIDRIFTERDADGSGTLSLKEAQGGRRPMSEERFGRMDANSDGSLSKEEFAAGFGRGGRPGTEGHRRPVEQHSN